MPVSKNSESDFRHFWIYKTHHKTKYDIIFAGDSRIYRGISPKTVETRMKDFKVLNLGYSSAGFSKDMLLEMEKRFSDNSNPNILVLGITPHSLTPRGLRNDHWKGEKKRKKEEIIESLYFYPFKAWFQPVTPIDIYDNLFKSNAKKSVVYHQELNKNGWVASWKEPANQEEALASYKKIFENNIVANEDIVSLMNTIKNLSDSGIIVFGFCPPSSEKMVILENELSNFNEEEFIWLFKHAGGIWLDVDKTGLSSYDGSHLDKTSAIKLSDIIATMITANLDSLSTFP